MMDRRQREGPRGRFQRQVRPRQEDSEPEESVSSEDESAPELEGSEVDSGAESLTDEEESSDLGEEDEDDAGDNAADLEEDLGAISFGALARAQQSLGKRKRASEDAASQGESGKLNAIRERLHAIKEQKEKRDGSKKATSSTTHDENAKANSTTRSSKHAPRILSSKRAVTRKRDVIDAPARTSRDPRFDSLSGTLDRDRTRKNYSFLDDYKDDEMKQLREAIKRLKKGDEETKETLKRRLLSMESKQKAQAEFDRRRDILRTHRAKEKELVKQGKKPFYLKKGEQNKLALVSRYDELKSDKKRERAMERRRTKEAQREKRQMPMERRR